MMVMAGLPATGKTTTAQRLHAQRQDPSGDRPAPPIVVVDTVREVVAPPLAGPEAAVRVAAALLPYAQGRAPS